MKVTIDLDDNKYQELLDFLKGIQAEPTINYPAFPELPYTPTGINTGAGQYNPCERCSNKDKGFCHCALPAMANPMYC